MWVRCPITKRMIKVHRGHTVVIQSSARIGSTWPKNHGMRHVPR